MRTLALLGGLFIAVCANAAEFHIPPWIDGTTGQEMPSNDSTYLYLFFADKGFPYPGSLLTWMHPFYRRTGTYEETFMPNEESRHNLFKIELVQARNDGYELRFQPRNPRSAKPLRKQDIRAFFPRSTRKRINLSDKVSVIGIYGAPGLFR